MGDKEISDALERVRRNSRQADALYANALAEISSDGQLPLQLTLKAMAAFAVLLLAGAAMVTAVSS